MHQITEIVQVQHNYLLQILSMYFFVYFDVLSDDGFPIENKGFFRARVHRNALSISRSSDNIFTRLSVILRYKKEKNMFNLNLETSDNIRLIWPH